MTREQAELPLPPDELIFMNQTAELGVRQGKVQATRLGQHGANLKDSVVLDVGCGWGRLAYGLHANGFSGTYVGVDIKQSQVDWLRSSFTPAAPGYSFHRVDVQNDHYNPDGTKALAPYDEFLPGDHADTIIMLSVFTHMYADDIRTHLKEVRAVMAPGSRLYMTCFLFDGPAQDGINTGVSRRTFQHELNKNCRFDIASKPLAAIAYTEPFMQDMLADAGLKGEVLRGFWSYKNSPTRPALATFTKPPFNQDLVICSPSRP